MENQKELNEPEDNTTEKEDMSLWEHDQEHHDYYYDDSTGYETYNPDEEDEEDN